MTLARMLPLLLASAITVCGCREEPPRPPPPLTQSQSDWVRDVCIVEHLRGGGVGRWAAKECISIARRVVK